MVSGTVRLPLRRGKASILRGLGLADALFFALFPPPFFLWLHLSTYLEPEGFIKKEIRIFERCDAISHLVSS